MCLNVFAHVFALGKIGGDLTKRARQLTLTIIGILNLDENMLQAFQVH